MSSTLSFPDSDFFPSLCCVTCESRFGRSIKQQKRRLFTIVSKSKPPPRKMMKPSENSGKLPFDVAFFCKSSNSKPGVHNHVSMVQLNKLGTIMLILLQAEVTQLIKEVSICRTRRIAQYHTVQYHTVPYRKKNFNIKGSTNHLQKPFFTLLQPAFCLLGHHSHTMHLF